VQFASVIAKHFSMKKTNLALFIMLLLSALYTTAAAQVRKIPASVTEAFKDKYPSAAHVEWKDKLSGFTASFEEHDIKYEARFNNKGVWESTENKIENDDLPEAVSNGFDKSKYADEWTIESIYKIELPDDKIQYRIQVAKSDLQKKNLLFNSEGRLLKDRITL
jgi:hypothetical protein